MSTFEGASISVISDRTGSDIDYSSDMDYSSDIEYHSPPPVSALMSDQYGREYDDGITFEQRRPTSAAGDNSVRHLTNTVRFLHALPPGLVRTGSSLYECDPQSPHEDDMIPIKRPTLSRSASVCCTTDPYDDMDCVSAETDNHRSGDTPYGSLSYFPPEEILASSLPKRLSHMMRRSNAGPDVEYVRHLVAAMACEMSVAERMELIALLASV